MRINVATAFILSCGLVSAVFEYAREMEAGSAMQVVSCRELGQTLEYESSTKPVIDFCSELTHLNDSDMDVRVLAYCVKTDIRSVPYTSEELLLSIKHREKETYWLVVAERGPNGKLIELRAPTHNTKFQCTISLERVDEKAIQEFLESTTFGFYDFRVSTEETLFIARASGDLSFLKHPLSEAQRNGRMVKFVPPGP